MKIPLPRTPTITLLILIASGCSDSERVAQVALEAAQRQAALDQELVRLNREVAEGHHQLLAGQSQVNEHMLALNQDLQQQRQELATESRQIASQRVHESLLAPILATFGALLVAALPLGLCYLLLYGLGQESTDVALTQILVDEITTEADFLGEPDLSAARIDASAPRALPQLDERI